MARLRPARIGVVTVVDANLVGRLEKGYVARLIRLGFLSPAVVEAVMEGRTPAALNLQTLMAKAAHFAINLARSGAPADDREIIQSPR
jgi:hypothetical protein